MRAISLALVVALMTSFVPVAAQERIDATDGPIHRAMTREAVQLAATSRDPTASVIKNVEPGRQSRTSDWSRVYQLTPVAEIIVTVLGEPPALRYLLAGNESELLVLDGASPALSMAAKDMLREAVSTHDLRNAASADPFFAWAFVQRKSVLLSPDGVFVGGLKIAEPEQVEHIVRSDVAEISLLAKPSLNSVLKWPILIGLGVGLATAIVSYKGYCGNHSCDSQEPLVFFLYPAWGAALGAGVGTLIWVGRGKTRVVIYRAP